MLGLHPGTGPHFGLAPFVQGHKPFSSSPVVFVYHRGVRVVAVFLKSFPELAIICKFFLKINNKKLSNFKRSLTNLEKLSQAVSSVTKTQKMTVFANRLNKHTVV